jgi:hypothetical protein
MLFTVSAIFSQVAAILAVGRIFGHGAQVAVKSLDLAGVGLLLGLDQQNVGAMFAPDRFK